jgi:hypothetical protein
VAGSRDGDGAFTVDSDAVLPSGLKYGDLEVLVKMREHGVSLTDPHDLAYYLYALTGPTAEAIADAAAQRRFLTEVHPSPDGPGRWTIVCRRRVVLSKQYVAAATDFFEHLAEEFDADYDGWEAAV